MTFYSMHDVMLLSSRSQYKILNWTKRNVRCIMVVGRRLRPVNRELFEN